MAEKSLDDARRRILLVLENAGSGSGRHVLDLCRGLIARGHDVTLLYSRSRLENWFEEELAATTALNAVTLDMRPGLRLADIASCRAVRRYLNARGPFDVIHGHSAKGGALARLAARARDGVRVYTPHALYTLRFAPGSIPGRFYGLLEKTLARECEGIICVSSAEHRHAVTLGLPSTKLFTVENGLAPLPPVDRDALRRHLRLADDNVAIGFVGRLAAQKAVHRLINAFAKVHAVQPRARLVIVGCGPDEAALRSLARKTSAADAIVWTGEVNGPQIMGALDIFALSSRYEAFPYALLEAAARELPIVSTRVGGVTELVVDDENGVVVEQDDGDGLVRALTDLVRDSARRQAMGAASKRIVRQYDFAGMVRKTLDVYTTLLERHA